MTVTVGAAPAPDLVVDAPTVSNSSPAAGGSFTLRTTVRNQGTGRSSSTTLRYYRSTDATVSTSDTEVGTDRVSSLSASRTSSEFISLRAPASAGTYYYGACVESVTGETSTGNNCSAAVTLTVGAAPAPDLVVDSPTVSNSSPAAGASFTLRTTVRNQGTGRSSSTTLRYYRSTDARVSTSDTEVGTDRVSSLSASRTSSEFISLRAPASAGTYYYGGVRRERHWRNQYRKQLLRCRDPDRGRRSGPRPGCRRPYGQQQQPRGRRLLHPEGHRPQPGIRAVKLDHPALLPVHRRDGLHQRHPGRHRPGQQPVRFPHQLRVDQPARPLQRRHLLLRGLRRDCSAAVSGETNTGNNCSGRAAA